MNFPTVSAVFPARYGMPRPPATAAGPAFGPHRGEPETAESPANTATRNGQRCRRTSSGTECHGVVSAVTAALTTRPEGLDAGGDAAGSSWRPRTQTRSLVAHTKTCVSCSGKCRSFNDDNWSSPSFPERAGICVSRSCVSSVDDGTQTHLRRLPRQCTSQGEVEVLSVPQLTPPPWGTLNTPHAGTL